MTDLTMTSRSSSWLSACSAASARSSVLMCESFASPAGTVKFPGPAAHVAMAPRVTDSHHLMYVACRLRRVDHAHHVQPRRRSAGRGAAPHGHARADRPDSRGIARADRARERPATRAAGRHPAVLARAVAPACQGSESPVILVDTSVWVDHLRAGNAALA